MTSRAAVIDVPALLFDLNPGKTVASYPALTKDGGLVIGSDDGHLYDIGS